MIIKCPYCGERHNIKKIYNNSKQLVCGNCRNYIKITLSNRLILYFKIFFSAKPKSSNSPKKITCSCSSKSYHDSYPYTNIRKKNTLKYSSREIKTNTNKFKDEFLLKIPRINLEINRYLEHLAKEAWTNPNIHPKTFLLQPSLLGHPKTIRHLSKIIT